MGLERLVVVAALGLGGETRLAVGGGRGAEGTGEVGLERLVDHRQRAVADGQRVDLHGPGVGRGLARRQLELPVARAFRVLPQVGPWCLDDETGQQDRAIEQLAQPDRELDALRGQQGGSIGRETIGVLDRNAGKRDGRSAGEPDVEIGNVDLAVQGRGSLTLDHRTKPVPVPQQDQQDDDRKRQGPPDPSLLARVRHSRPALECSPTLVPQP